MAQTKKRAAPKRSRDSQKSQARSRGSSSKSSSSKSKSPNGAARVDAVRHTVEDKAKNAGQTVGKAAGKAKVPLIAGGAALAGAAGGMALATRHERQHRSVGMRKPRIKLSSHDVAKAAKEVGNFSSQMGELASELQRAREAAGNSGHRSPVEVVLQGLTARR